MKLVPVVVRLNGHTVELGQAVMGEDERRAWLELEPQRVRQVLRELTPQERGLPPRPRPVAHTFQGPTTERCVADLEWLAERSQRGLADPKKAKWHATLRAQLASILEELNRLQSR